MQLLINACHAEWYFRSSLDRYVWIHGMLFAYLHPSFDAGLQRIDKMSVRARFAIRAVIVAGKGNCAAATEMHADQSVTQSTNLLMF